MRRLFLSKRENMRTEKNKSFIFYAEWAQYFGMVEDAQAALLLQAIVAYSQTQTPAESEAMSDVSKALYIVMTNQIARDKAKFEARCEARKVAGAKGGRPKSDTPQGNTPNNQLDKKKPKKPIGYFANQKNQKNPDNDNDNDNENENENENDKYSHRQAVDEKATGMAALLYTLHKENVDQNYVVKEKQIQSWSADIEKIVRIDGRTWEDVEKVIRWVKADSFWASNIMSGSKLRKQFDQVYGKMTARRLPPRSQIVPGGEEITLGGIQ